MGARLKLWQRSRVPKKGSRDEAVGISRGFAAQISLDYITTVRPPNLTRLLHNTASYAGYQFGGRSFCLNFDKFRDTAPAANSTCD